MGIENPGTYRERGGETARKPFLKKKICRFCADPNLKIDYKDAKALRYYLTERGKITPRRVNGACAKHQRELANAIKRARNMAIIPFTTISFERMD